MLVVTALCIVNAKIANVNHALSTGQLFFRRLHVRDQFARSPSFQEQTIADKQEFVK